MATYVRRRAPHATQVASLRMHATQVAPRRGRKLLPRPGSERVFTTAAGLARKLGVNRSTITRRLRKLSGGMKTRIGHQFLLDRNKQAQLRKRPR